MNIRLVDGAIEACIIAKIYAKEQVENYKKLGIASIVSIYEEDLERYEKLQKELVLEREKAEL